MDDELGAVVEEQDDGLEQPAPAVDAEDVVVAGFSSTWARDSPFTNARTVPPVVATPDRLPADPQPPTVSRTGPWRPAR